MLKEIVERGCIRDYSDKQISEEDIKKILEAGRLAPSWMNVQPWHFIVTKNKALKEMLSKSAGGQKQISEASHVIIILANLNAWKDENFSKILAQRGMQQEAISFILANKSYNPAKNSEAILIARTLEQCSYPMAFMNLQAKKLGIDSCIIGAFANHLTELNPQMEKLMKKELNIPNGMFVASMLTLGYRKENIQDLPKIRKDVNEIISIDKYENH